MEWMARDATYRYQDREEECNCSLADIRHHPMATCDTVTHLLKRMWDMETAADGTLRSVDDHAWQELRTHLEQMLENAIEGMPELHARSARAEWIYEREGGSRECSRGCVPEGLTT